MNIIALLKKLIKNSNNNNIDLISLNSLIPLPTRENYLNNPDMLNLIAKVKKEYLVKINSKKFITSLDINNKDLINNLLMYLDIILNNILNYDEKIEQINLEDKINYLIKTRKLILYLKTIKNEAFIVTANLIALQEILSNQKFISKNKKEALKNEINNLSNILITYLVKEKALILETSSYLDKYVYQLEEKEEIIEIKKKKLTEYAKIILNKNIFLSNNLMELASLEKELEEWVYKHKEESQSLKKQLDNICTLEFSFNNKDKLIKLINPLEIKYWLFYEYGKDLILEEDLKDFYLIKFNILILSQNGISETIINEKTNDLEFLCYSNIINREIEDLKKGNGELNKPAQIEIILNILKNNQDIINLKAILKSKYLFNLCLAMNSKQALINFLKNFKINYLKYNNLNIISALHSLGFEEELPLETIYRIMLALNSQHDAKLYEILQNDIYPDENYYYLPEGLKEIVNLPSSFKFLTKEENLVINKIWDLSKDKNIVFPPSFKKLSNSKYLFEDNQSKNFIIDNIKIPFNVDFVIDKNNGNIITYCNISKETVTYNKSAFIQNKWGNFPAYGILKFIPDKKMYIEQYYNNFYNFNHLLNRNYIDITTKYGNFCLCIEENYTKRYDSPNISISLYHGQHNEIIDNLTNDFDFQKYLIYRNKLVFHERFEQWIVGSFKYDYRNIWNYDKAIYEGKEIDSPIYAFQSSNGNLGFIIDGKLKISENKKYLPDLFYEDIVFKEFEEQSGLGLKAFFGNYKECLFIFKNEKGYLEFIIKKYIKGQWLKEEATVKATIGKIFTNINKDIIKSNITKFNFSKDLEKCVIEEFTTFINNRYSLDGLFKILSQSNFAGLTKCNWKCKNDIIKQVELFIENISQNFYISLEELSVKKEEKEPLKLELK